MTQFIDQQKKSTLNIKNLKIGSLKKGDYVLARVTRAAEDFTSTLSPSVQHLIENSWSRIQVKNVSEFKLNISFCDYGLDIEINSESIYEFIQMPMQFKIWPTFVYACMLNKNTVDVGLAEAYKKNHFCNSIYFNDYLSRRVYLT